MRITKEHLKEHLDRDDVKVDVISKYTREYGVVQDNITCHVRQRYLICECLTITAKGDIDELRIPWTDIKVVTEGGFKTKTGIVVVFNKNI